MPSPAQGAASDELGTIGEHLVEVTQASQQALPREIAAWVKDLRARASVL
jgi:hypothetical protein